jgi:predicted DNA-binding transcriptional regulator YafY
MTEQVRRASRLLQIEGLLRRRPNGLSAAELAQELGYSTRTIQRDIAVLESELGVPLITAGRRYQILPGSHPLAPVRFTLHEARAIYLATRLFFRHSDEHDPDGIFALEKIAEALPDVLARQVQATAHQLKERPRNPRQSSILRDLTEALAASRTVAIHYRSVSSSAVKVLNVDPYLLEPSTTGAAIYVIGWSHEHGEIRTFKLDRIQSAELTAHIFVPRDIYELVAQMAKSWGVVFGEDRYDVAVEFSPAVAGRISETNWHPSQRLTPLPDGSVRLEIQLPSLLEFIPWVRSWGPDAFVIEPPELRRAVAESLHQASARYTTPPD